MKALTSAIDWVHRHARLVVVAWVGVALALTLTAPSLQKVGVQDDASFLPASSPSFIADTTLRRAYPNDPSRDAAYLVFVRNGGLTDADHAFIDDLPRLARTVTGVKHVETTKTSPALAAFLRSPDGAAELAVIDFSTAPFATQTNHDIDQLRTTLDRHAPEGLEHHVTGLPGLAADQAQGLIRSFETTAVVSIILVLLILIVVYRSVVTAFVPLITIGVAFLVARGVVAFLAQSGFEVSSLIETFMVVMIFGAGTDYCLFIVSRYQEELAAGHDTTETLKRTMRIIAGVIAASAATVIVAFSSLLTAKFGLYRSMGPGLAVGIALTLAAGLTLTPALLKLFGKRAFWPGTIDHVRRRAEHEHPRWQRIGAIIEHHPKLALVGATLPLLIASTGLLNYRQSFDLVKDLPPSADARQGFAALDGHLPTGRLSPVFLIIDTDHDVRTPADFAALDKLTRALRHANGVAEARSITQPAGQPLTLQTLDQLVPNATATVLKGVDTTDPAVIDAFRQLRQPTGLRITPELLRAAPEMAKILEPFLLGENNRAPRIVISFSGNPYSPDALSDFRRLDAIAADTLAGTSLAGSHLRVAGPTSFYADIQEVGARDFRVMSAVLILGIFIVLALLLRSLVAPFFLLATVVLSYTATLGITVIVFRGILHQEGITFWMPPFLFVILVALGADYNIFVMSRIREEFEAGATSHQAAVRGLVATGRVVTSAGLVLAGTFAALIAAPLPNLQQIGFAVTLGVLIDTVLVRTFLVPAITALVGDFAFWPAQGRASTPRGRAIQTVAVSVALAVLVAVVAAVIITAPLPSAASTVAGG